MKTRKISKYHAYAIIQHRRMDSDGDVNRDGYNKHIPSTGYLTDSGARLFVDDGVWYLSGYAADGSDVDCYFLNR